MVVLHIGDGRVLQVLLGAQNRLGAIWMVREEGCKGRLPHFAAVLGEGHILLLVDGLQLGVEAPDDRMTETIRLNLRPILDLVGRNVLHITGHVGGSEGVGPLCTYEGHKFVVLVGDGNLRSLVAE